MKKWLFLSILMIIAQVLYGQDSLLVGKKYFEDQLYLDFSSNTFFGKLDGFEQHGISLGFGMGFIKDIPINKKGNIGFGVGVGYSFNNYKQNIKIPDFTIVDIVSSTDANRFTTHAIEFPLSFRFRTSTSKIHPFFRIYAGGKISYIFASNSKYTSNTESLIIEVESIPFINQWQYGPQITVGYGNLNIYAYLIQNNIFKTNASSNDIDISELREYRIGLKVYLF